PFQPKEPVGTPKWYEKVGIGYTGIARNQVSFYDTSHTGLSSIFDTMQMGAQHRVPISLSLPPMGSFLIAHFVSYEETWYIHEYGYRWNPNKNDIDTVINRKGFYTDRQLSFGVGVNTAIYGTYQFKHSRLIALRHV